MRDVFNRNYKEGHHERWTRDWSSQGLRLVVENEEPGRFLDLGCGTGTDALFMAENGWDVTAVDISDVAIDKLRERADKKGLEIKTYDMDIRDFEFKGKYDVIISYNTLHYLEENYFREMIDKIKNHTKEGGVNFISTFYGERSTKNSKWVPGDGELEKMYEDWNIMGYRLNEEKTNQVIGVMKPRSE